MRPFFLLLALLASSPLVSAMAPESIAGKVYHESGGVPSTRAKWESIIIFGADGRYSFLKSARGSFVSNPAISLLTPPNDGNYSYARTGERSALITLDDASGTLNLGPSQGRTATLRIELTFTDSNRGVWSAQSGSGGFYLTDPAALSEQPMINLSVRSHVSPGRPAIAGFVVPGRAFSGRSVDLLIRVVGPSLAQFNIASPWTDPEFSLQLAPSNSHAYVGNWSDNAESAAAIEKISVYAGAFPLSRGAKDAVAIVRLMPGAYTIVCHAREGDPGGQALIEVYTLP